MKWRQVAHCVRPVAKHITDIPNHDATRVYVLCIKGLGIPGVADGSCIVNSRYLQREPARCNNKLLRGGSELRLRGMKRNPLAFGPAITAFGVLEYGIDPCALLGGCRTPRQCRKLWYRKLKSNLAKGCRQRWRGLTPTLPLLGAFQLFEKCTIWQSWYRTTIAT
jgi:hypothetical protein